MPLRGKYSYWRTLPHIQKGNRPLFVTFSTYKRWRLTEAACSLVLDSCVHQHTVKVDLHAAVVMPDHVHLVFTPLVGPEGWTFSLPEIMHAIKGRAAHAINLALKREGPVWQDEFFDHVLRSNDSLSEKIDYICQNPVRAGLVKEAQDYSWFWRRRVPVL